MAIRTVREFLKFEAAGGILLFITAVFALIMDNSALSPIYHSIFDAKLIIHLGPLNLEKPLLLWINDGFMAVFFMLVTLEIKREIFEGELNSRAKLMLPAIAAFGGMLMPALIYVFCVGHNPAFIKGWAIPVATDLAFALGVLALLSKRIPLSLKLFLTALAIFDDMGSIVVIAGYYTSDIAILNLLLAGLCIVALTVLNRLGVSKLGPYFMVGVLLWIFVLKSGVHATLAGVILAFAIPIRDKRNWERSPLRDLEHQLHPWVAFFILPIFAFANAGVSFAGMHWNELFQPVALGIALGLFIGKQIGIFGFTWATIKLGIAELPKNSSLLSVYGVSLICGIGFTMSLFIGTLAFGGDKTMLNVLVRVGVLSGSLVSGLLGYLLIRFGCEPVEEE